MMSRAAVFMSVLMVSLMHPAFPYVWAAEAVPGVEPAASPTTARTEQDLRFHALQSVVRSRSGDLAARDRTRAENRIEAHGRQVDKKAAQDPDGVLARISKEFDIEPATLLHQKKKLGAWWSELVIVHTILANVPRGIRADELLLLRKKGSSWSEIAYGLGFELRPFVDAARAECRVAAGLEPADGQVESLERNQDSAPSLWNEVSWIPEPAAAPISDDR